MQNRSFYASSQLVSLYSHLSLTFLYLFLLLLSGVANLADGWGQKSQSREMRETF